LLLGGRPPYFNELLQHLAAIPQALAFLELIKKNNCFAGQIGDELKTAFRGKSTAIGAGIVGGIFSSLHRCSLVLGNNERSNTYD
jgi:hypothetical protein